MKRYKISEGNLQKFWDFLTGKKPAPKPIQKVIDDDPELKKIMKDYEKINSDTVVQLNRIKKENPDIYDYLKKAGFLSK
jgi:hypothetical protein